MLVLGSSTSLVQYIVSNMSKGEAMSIGAEILSFIEEHMHTYCGHEHCRGCETNTDYVYGSLSALEAKVAIIEEIDYMITEWRDLANIE